MAEELKEKTNNLETEQTTEDAMSELEAMLQSDEVQELMSTPNNEVETPVLENVVEEELSPLEKMKRANAEGKGQQSGIIMKESSNTGNEPLRDFVHNDERMADINESIKELDRSIDKRKAVVLIKQPEDQFQFVKCMSEIDSVEFDSLGKAFINITDAEGNPVEPEFIRIRKDDEEIFDFDSLGVKLEEKNENTTETSEVKELSEEEIKKKKTVEILIDKTGLGTDFLFTKEEKEKIAEAETILINEVKVDDINAVRSKRSEVSFQDVINDFDTSGSRTTICFPASGFKAQMKGMSYGEYADVALSMENVTFDQYYKRLSVIYNKMTNISTGPFENFEDFLKNLAYTDIPMALYGLLISTEDEDQEIQLKCGRSECDKLFNWKYSTRSLLRLEKCADKFLDKMKEIATAPAAEFDNIQADSAVHNSKFLEMPQSHFIVEMGIASAYDFLYNFIPLMDENTFKEAFGEDLNQIYLNNVLLSTSIRSVYVPDGKGGYIECTGYKDILDAIYKITPEEIKILAAYTAKIQSEYEITFSFGNVTCPHCGNVTEDMEVNMDDLVFQTYSRLMNTEVDLKNIPDL